MRDIATEASNAVLTRKCPKSCGQLKEIDFTPSRGETEDTHSRKGLGLAPLLYCPVCHYEVTV